MFWILIVLLILVALAFVLPPLLRKVGGIEDDRREQNIAIAQLQLSELESEFKEGRIEEISYKASKEELEQALYDDLESEEDRGQGRSMLGQKTTAIAVAVFVPLLAVVLYAYLGSPAGLEESQTSTTSQEGHAGLSAKQQKQLDSIDKMVGSLEAKLKAEPNNLKGWVMLGRTYMVLKRYGDAVKAYETADKLQANNPEILLPMADALATANQGDLTGRPEKLIKQALQADPQNMMGLWLAGMAAEQRGVNNEAIAHWKKLEAMLDPASLDRKEVRDLIARAGGVLDPLPVEPAAQGVPAVSASSEKPPVKSTNTQAITLTVSLSAELKDKVKPEDTVFIYAKAVAGPPMPLAAARKQVKDLPLEIKLDDSMAMMPQMKLSSFKEVKVGARISLSGTPQAQTGDLFAEQSPVKAGDSVTLEISQVVGQ